MLLQSLFVQKTVIEVSGFYKSRKKGGLFAITPRSKKRGGVEKVNLENSSLEVQTENKEIVDFGANINKNLISNDSNFLNSNSFSVGKIKGSMEIC